MNKRQVSRLLAAAFLMSAVAPGPAETVREDFSTAPVQRGWTAQGETNLFQWSQAAGRLDVTWDSSKPNSYFALPLGQELGTDADFSVSFDLGLVWYASGINPAKPFPFQVAVGFISKAAATDPKFIRGTGYTSPHLAEFSFFPDPGGEWQWGPSVTAALVDETGSHWSKGGFAPLDLPSNQVYRITMRYAADKKQLATSIESNGQPVGTVPVALLESSFQNFALDHWGVCSYSDEGQDPAYSGSVLARGYIDNVTIELPSAQTAPRLLVSAFTDASFQAQVQTASGRTYTLERSTNFADWGAVAPGREGTGGVVALSDPAPPATRAFYRVRISQP